MQVAVIGAGVMGSAIAAQMANCGYEVLLFDRMQDGQMLAQIAKEKLLKQKPPPLLVGSLASKILAYDIEQDHTQLKNCDLVIEAIIEDEGAKAQLYRLLVQTVKDDCILVSNTSTFRLNVIRSWIPEAKHAIAICHFFNPPRYLRLLEFIADFADPRILELEAFLRKIGKTVIRCKDSPGFIGNRIGCYTIQLALHTAVRLQLKTDEVDRALAAIGFPSTGIFGLIDLIGFDIVFAMNDSLLRHLNGDELYMAVSSPIANMQKMHANGASGRKSGQGFYKRGDGGKYAINLLSWEYEPVEEHGPQESLQEILAKKDGMAEFIETMLHGITQYAERVAEEVADNPYDIDKAMKLGYAWKYGPFGMAAEFLGAKEGFIAQMAEVGPRSLPSASSEVLMMSDSAKLHLLKDGKLCFELLTKMNVLTTSAFEMLQQSIQYAQQIDAPLVIYSDSANFCCGADIKYLYSASPQELQEFMLLGQRTMHALKNASIPTIACARGLALGGGCELLLHCDYVVAHQDLTAGLVEVSLGLAPGWGGMKEVILRGLDFGLITSSKKSSSSMEWAEDFAVKNCITVANTLDLLEAVLHKNFEHVIKQDISISSASLNSVIKPGNSFSDMILAYLQDFNTLDTQILFDLERRVFLNLLSKVDVRDGLKKRFAK